MLPSHSHRIAAAAITLFVTLATPRKSVAQEDGAPGRTPTGARRAAEWRPTREGLDSNPVYFSATVGLGFFSGDEAIDDVGFTAELHGSGEITGGLYFAGSYLLAFVQTEGFFGEDDTHFLHAPTVGLGYRAEIMPEIHLFIEPRIGVLFGGEDAAPIGGAAAGAEFQLNPGLLLHARFTGLLTDAEVDTGTFNADLDAIWSVGVGVTFEF